MKLLSKEDYYVGLNTDDDKAKKLNISKKKKYTIVEGIKLFETVSNCKTAQVTHSNFWAKV